MQRFVAIRSVDVWLSNHPKGVVLLRLGFAGFSTPRLVVYGIAGIPLALGRCSLQYAECILQCAGGKLDLLSYRHSFTEHLLPQLRIQPLLGHYFNPAAKKIFEIQNETSRKPSAGRWPNINEQVEIAVWFSLSACYRTEDFDTADTMLSSDTSDVFTFLAKCIFSDH